MNGFACYPICSRRAKGALCLAMSLCSLASPPSAVHAQEQTRFKLSLPPKEAKPLSPELKASVTEILAVAKQESLCKTRVDLKVENASLDDVLKRLQENLFDQTLSVEVRGALPVKDSFAVKETRAGDVLQHMAALAACDLYLLPKGLLIAPASKLTEAEQKSIEQEHGGLYSTDADINGNNRWSLPELTLAEALAQEATATDAIPQPPVDVHILFGNFSPQGQEILAFFAATSHERVLVSAPWSPPLSLDAKSIIDVDTTDPKTIHITLRQDDSTFVSAGFYNLPKAPTN